MRAYGQVRAWCKRIKTIQAGSGKKWFGTRVVNKPSERLKCKAQLRNEVIEHE